MRRSVVLGLLAACGSSGNSPIDSPAGGGGDGRGVDSALGGVDAAPPDAAMAAPPTIFIIPMENESASSIYNNTTYAPYINNTLVPMAAKATMFTDELPQTTPSEPHYVWMEGGTNAYSDHTFTNDNDSSTSNATASTEHLVTQLQAANLTWVSYQEGITAGTCPITSISSRFYAAKHDPFVFFKDVAGSPPSSSNAYCAAHHKPYVSADFANDLNAGTMPNLVFITPNLCHDMHGASACPQGTNTSLNIRAGDTWLQNELPRILAYASAHGSIVYLTWDEGSSNNLMPFLALGPHVKAGSVSSVVYSHSSQLKSIEEQLGVPVLPTVASANDFADLFQTGYFP